MEEDEEVSESLMDPGVISSSVEAVGADVAGGATAGNRWAQVFRTSVSHGF